MASAERPRPDHGFAVVETLLLGTLVAFTAATLVLAILTIRSV